jgi:hypothetical protein
MLPLIARMLAVFTAASLAVAAPADKVTKESITSGGQGHVWKNRQVKT